MVDIETYISDLIGLLKKCFGSRLVYVGLQGSYLRGEANENSDLDIMVIIDSLDAEALAAYRGIIQSMEHYEKSCGFICGKADLRSWNPLEICNLMHSTKDYYGVLSELVPPYTRQDIRNFIKFSVNNLYHEICHRFIHADEEANKEFLPGTYKGVFFILQNLYYLTHGRFCQTKAELLKLSGGVNHSVLLRAMELNQGTDWDFQDSFELLLSWCQEVMASDALRGESSY